MVHLFGFDRMTSYFPVYLPLRVRSINKVSVVNVRVYTLIPTESDRSGSVQWTTGIGVFTFFGSGRLDLVGVLVLFL